MKRYLLYASFLLLALIVGLSVYLVLPPLRSRISEVPREPPVALAPDNANRGERCKPGTTFCFDGKYCDEGQIVDAYCADMQRKLAQAAHSGDLIGARKALAMGANATSRVSEAGESNSPLIEAALFGHTSVVRLLLDNGADVNEVHVCCFSASTALMEATRYNHVETAKLLLARGADVHFVGYENWTALKDAEQSGNQDMVDLLDAAGAMSWRHRAERRWLRLLGKDPKEHHYRYPD